MSAEPVGRLAVEAAIASLEAQRATLGDDVVDIAIAPLRAQLAAETSTPLTLKHATMLFVDLVGSTSMAARMDPEDFAEIVDKALRRFTEVVDDHDGRVFGYMGDGLVAVFGADHAREDDAERAVRAALAVIDAAADLTRGAERVDVEREGVAGQVTGRLPVPGIAVRTGVSSGPVALGGGVQDATSLRGNAVNVAARMEQSAPVGGLRISQTTYRLVRGIFDVTSEPPIQVKGIAEPVPTYLVHGAKPRAFRSVDRGIDGVETPLVGRDDSLAELFRAFDRLYAHDRTGDDVPDGDDRTGDDDPGDDPGDDDPGGEERRFELVLVVGEPGIGKSRLLDEFEDWAELRPEVFVSFRGRAHPHTVHQPFGLLRGLFAWRFEIADDLAAVDARRRFLDGLAPLLGDDEPAAHLLGHLIGFDFSDSAHVVGIAGDPQQIRARAFAGAARALRSFVDEAPVVALIEDLHWADDESLDFLAYLARRHSDLAMLVVGTGRPSIDDRSAEWIAEIGANRIDLAALEPADAATLAATLLARVDDPTPELIEALLARTDGNPFFIEAVVQMLLDEGALVDSVTVDGVPGRWRIAPEHLSIASIPTTLTGVLQARLDALLVDQRRALQQASVVGFQFWDRAIGAIDERSPAELDPLSQRGLVHADPESSVVEARQFSFRHHLLQQFAYETIVKRDRREYHARAAAWLTELARDRGPEFLAATAAHYEQAGDEAAALDHYVRAAESAAARGAGSSVISAVEAALAITPADDHETRWRLLVTREDVLALGADRDAHDEDLGELVRLADVSADDGRRAFAALRRAVALLDRADHLDGEVEGRRAVDLADRSGAAEIGALALAALARAARRTDRPVEAAELAGRSLEIARGLDDRRTLCKALAEAAGARTLAGDHHGQLALDREALELAQGSGDRLLEAQLLNAVGIGLFTLGEVDEARSLLERSARLSAEVDWTYGEAIAFVNLCDLATTVGSDADAIVAGERAVAIAAVAGWRDLEAVALLHLGVARGRLGLLEASRAELTLSVELFTENDGAHYALEPTAALAYLDFVEGDGASARARVDEVLAYIDDKGDLTGIEDPFRVRTECYLVLHGLDDPRAEPFLADTRAALDELLAGAVDDAERTRMVQSVPNRAAIIELSDALT